MRPSVAGGILCFLVVAAPAHAFTTGATGYSGKDKGETCTECHTAGPQQPSAMLLGPTTLHAGQSGLYQLVVDTDVTTTASVKHWVGFDIAASDGATLATVQQPNATRLLAGDVSHTDAVPRSKLLGVHFLVTAPTTPGRLTLYAAALATDWTFTVANDTTATTTLSVDVLPPADLGGIDALSAATAYPPTKPSTKVVADEPRWGCQVAPHAERHFTQVFFIFMALVAVRRRLFSR